MVRRIVTPEAGAPSSVSEGTASKTRALLACGIVAGPLFLAVALTQAFTRQGFDLSRHPLSLLSLGDLGWIQITSFVVTGVLYVACAVGMRRALGPGPGAAWGPRLVGVLGIGLIMGGVFLTDAGAGFPPGAPAGAPEISWHGMLHNVAPSWRWTGWSWAAWSSRAGSPPSSREVGQQRGLPPRWRCWCSPSGPTWTASACDWWWRRQSSSASWRHWRPT
jgi:hypothetical protein